MTPVFQTVVGPADAEKGKKGNCMQAVFASLLDLPLEQVPHFIEEEEDGWFETLWNFLKIHGYDYQGYINNPRDVGCWGEDDLMRKLQEAEGINGYFYAVVYSPKYFDAEKYCKGERVNTHAVIVNNKGEIVHDPNPAYKDLEEYPLAKVIGYRGIKYIYDIRKAVQ